jgi:hypothetical protein
LSVLQASLAAAPISQTLTEPQSGNLHALPVERSDGRRAENFLIGIFHPLLFFQSEDKTPTFHLGRSTQREIAERQHPTTSIASLHNREISHAVVLAATHLVVVRIGTIPMTPVITARDEARPKCIQKYLMLNWGMVRSAVQGGNLIEGKWFCCADWWLIPYTQEALTALRRARQVLSPRGKCSVRPLTDIQSAKETFRDIKRLDREILAWTFIRQRSRLRSWIPPVS